MSNEAVDRAVEMMKIPMNELPKRAIGYAKFMCNKYMMCGEVLLTSWAHYAQAVEGLECDDDLYKITEEGKEFFDGRRT